MEIKREREVHYHAMTVVIRIRYSGTLGARQPESRKQGDQLTWPIDLEFELNPPLAPTTT